MALWCPPRGELGLQQLAHALFRPSRSCVDLLRLAPANPIKLVDILHAQLRQIRFVADNGAWSPLASGAAPAAPVEGPGTTPGATLEEAVRPLIRRRRVAASVTRWGLTRVSVRRRCAALAVAERLDPRRRGGALLRDGGRAVRRRRQPPLLLARRRDALRPTWRPGQRVTSLAFERAPEAVPPIAQITILACAVRTAGSKKKTSACNPPRAIGSSRRSFSAASTTFFAMN